MTIIEVNALDDAAFVARFGFLAEHSPWVVAAAAAKRPFADLAAMQAALLGVIAGAATERQLALLRAHPQLADKLAIARGLTAESAAEQASAGLDRLTPAEFALFQRRNDDYFRLFGFPFIICVRLTDKAGILAAMAERLQRTKSQEIAAALDQVGKIIALRLADEIAS